MNPPAHDRLTEPRPLPSEAEDSLQAGTDVEVIRPGKPSQLPTHLPLWQQVLVLSIWPMLDAFAVWAVHFVDTALAGRLEPAAMNAVGGVGYLLWLMGLLQGAVGVGATALIARSMGANKRDEANLAFAQAMVLAFAWGVVNFVMFYLAAPYIGPLVRLEGDAEEYCRIYIQILAFVAPARALLFIGSACIRGAGDTRSPFFMMVAVNAINIAFSVTAVELGFGLVGIAWGTAVAWLVGGAIIITLALRGIGGLKMHAPDLKPLAGMIWRILKVGIPNLVESLGHWGGNFIVVLIIAHLSVVLAEPNMIGTHMIAIRIEAVSFMPAFAIGIAAATLAGQYLGANDPKQAKHAVWLCLLMGAVLSGLIGISFIALPHWWTRLITDNPVFLEPAAELIGFIGFVQIGFAAYLVLSGGLRGAGDTRTTMIMLYVTTFTVRLPLVWLLGVVLEGGLFGVWVALGLELVVRGAVFFVRFLHGGWTRVEV